MRWKWRCIICEKEMEIDSGNEGSLKDGLWPSVNGGTFSMDFGWPSRHDQMNLQHDRREWQGCICDDCFDKKQHLMREVHVKQHAIWELIKEKQDNLKKAEAKKTRIPPPLLT